LLEHPGFFSRRRINSLLAATRQLPDADAFEEVLKFVNGLRLELVDAGIGTPWTGPHREVA